MEHAHSRGSRAGAGQCDADRGLSHQLALRPAVQREPHRVLDPALLGRCRDAHVLGAGRLRRRRLGGGQREQRLGHDADPGRSDARSRERPSHLGRGPDARPGVGLLEHAQRERAVARRRVRDGGPVRHGRARAGHPGRSVVRRHRFSRLRLPAGGGVDPGRGGRGRAHRPCVGRRVPAHPVGMVHAAGERAGSPAAAASSSTRPSTSTRSA